MLSLEWNSTSKASVRRVIPPFVREAIFYFIGVVLAVTVVWFVLRLKHADLRVPINLPGDGVYYALLVKTLMETGWVHHNPSLSAPFELDFYDFPHFDSLHLGIMKVLGLFTRRWAVVLNLYYLLSFPLTTVTCLVLLRRLGLHSAVCLTFSLLYAFQPYH
jgi:phosphoglycerol transferase